MKTSKHTLLVALGACMLLPISNTALAEEEVTAPDTSKWVCKFCPEPGGWFGNWDLGLIYVDDPTPKFADYRGLSDDGFYVEASGDTSYRGENGYFFDFYGRDLGLRSRDIDMRGGKQGSYEIRAEYSEIPRYLGHGTVTPYEGVGTDTLVLPPGWQSEELARAKLKVSRKTYGAGFTLKFAGSWKFDADFQRQKRDGTKTFGGGLFAINGALFPAPIDYRTNLFNTGLEYNSSRGQLRVEFISSDFDNNYNSVTWDNPIVIGFGDEVSRSALEPDNKFHQISLAGAVRFSRRVRFSGKVGFGKIEQDDPFLPYTINPAYADLDLPRQSLDGKIDTRMVNIAGRLYIKLADRLDLTAAYKLDERDNRTPRDTYTPVMLEVFTRGPRTNRPYSYDRSQLKAELRWRPSHKVRVNAGAKKDTLDRTYQEIRKSDENSYWGDVQFNLWTWLDTRLKYEYLTRDTGIHMQQGNYDRAENPLMRKFNMADRDRKRGTVEFNIYPLDRFSINLSYYVTDDDYDNSEIGLTSGKESSINMDLNYALGEATTLYGFITKDSIKSDISGADSFGAVPWNAFTDDDILTWGVGIKGKIKEKFTYGFDYLWSRAEGDILTDSGAGEAPFPTLKTKLRNARFYMDYDLNGRWGLGLDAYREQYDSADWYIDGFGPQDISGLLTMGEISPEYDVWVVRMMATLTF